MPNNQPKTYVEGNNQGRIQEILESVAHEGNVLNLVNCMYARVHKLSTTSTHKGSQTVVDPSTYQSPYTA